MEFVSIGKLSKSKDEIKATIQQLGGKLVTQIHPKLAAVISNELEVEKLSYKMAEAKDAGIQVVTVDFLDEVKSGGAIDYIKAKSICVWGTDVSFFFFFF